MFHNGSWGTVCDDQWTIEDANVVCRQLDFEGALKAVASAHFGRGTGNIWMDDVYCVGNERILTECIHEGWGNTIVAIVRTQVQYASYQVNRKCPC